MLYGTQGRIISGIAGAGAISSAILYSLQQSNIFSLIPAKYTWVQGVVTAVLVFITLFSERLQGGASNPEVRAAAEASDNKKALEELNR